MWFDMSRSYTHGIFRYLSKAVSASTYQYGKILFWIAAAIVSTAGLSTVAIHSGYSVPYIPLLIENPSNDFFGSSLNLILSIVSLVFVIVIFLIQNANQESVLHKSIS